MAYSAPPCGRICLQRYSNQEEKNSLRKKSTFAFLLHRQHNNYLQYINFVSKNLYENPLIHTQHRANRWPCGLYEFPSGTIHNRPTNQRVHASWLFKFRFRRNNRSNHCIHQRAEQPSQLRSTSSHFHVGYTSAANVQGQLYTNPYNHKSRWNYPNDKPFGLRPKRLIYLWLFSKDGWELQAGSILLWTDFQ